MTPLLRAAAAAAAIACAVPAHAQTAADLFDRSTLQDIRVWLNSRDLRTLHEQVQASTRYAADVEWRGLTVHNAAVRSHGGTSRNPTKPGLSIEFNRYTSRGELAGQTALVLDSLVQDPGLVREHLAMEFFSRMGQPAPRTSFARVYINNEYYGVYGVLEAIDERFLQRAFERSDGFVYEYKLTDPYHGEYLGGELGPYRSRFEPRTRKLDGDAVLYVPIEEMVREINAEMDGVWRERVERNLDLAQLVTHVAIETFLAEEDGILGIYGMNNFSLFRPAGSTQHRFIPRDKDKVFLAVDAGIFDRADENVWFSRAMTFPDLRSLYLDTLERCARAAAEEGWLAVRIGAAAAVVDAAVREDSRKPFGNDDYDATIAFFLDFAERRPAFVLDAVSKAR